MKLHFLVEGPADVAFLEELLPRLIPEHQWQVYPHQGKGKLPGDLQSSVDPLRRGLLDNLPAKLRAWGRSMESAVDRVVVLVALDKDDCRETLEKLRRMYETISPRPEAIFRLAIEETESWYLGDRRAIKEAFPKARLRRLQGWTPDSAVGSWELFMEVIEAASDDKVAWGEVMGKTLRLAEPLERCNESPSFRKFCRRVREHAGCRVPAKRLAGTKPGR